VTSGSVNTGQQMRIINLNLEGIRQATQKGFFDWMIHEDADVVCLQNTLAAA
jgi:exodeoxyribonuclease-3